ncbi:MAG: hypothetical protein GJU77_04305 [Ferrovum sp.]|jgi:hypothetical protein|nr:hypothetical protein [Ferrovum sp.]
MSIPVTTPLVTFNSTPESQVNELYSVLLTVLIEAMDFPPKKPDSTDSYLPPAIHDKILSVLEKVNPALQSEMVRWQDYSAFIEDCYRKHLA